jgi:2-phospho-L-lactate guanylyltransferase
MRVLVPLDTRDPNTRLAELLEEKERAALAAAMCRDVLAAVRAAGHDPALLATAPVSFDAPAESDPPERGVPVTVDDRPLSAAVNAALADAELPVAVVMADLPLVTPATVDRLTAPDADVVIAPGLGGGTNALVVRHPEFRVDYHGGSYRTHCRAAEQHGTLATVDSFRLALDVDTPADIGEVLLHGERRTAGWLADRFALDESQDRAAVERR